MPGKGPLLTYGSRTYGTINPVMYATDIDSYDSYIDVMNRSARLPV